MKCWTLKIEEMGYSGSDLPQFHLFPEIGNHLFFHDSDGNAGGGG